jgi:N-acetylglutamate synthase-like GNAT family acetyltransferase
MDSMSIFHPVTEEDRKDIARLATDKWGTIQMMSPSGMHDLTAQEGFVAYEGDRMTGFITYVISNDVCEITSLLSVKEGKGIGTRLIELVREKAQLSHCRRLWLVTTNDNIEAIKFYQKRGFILATIYKNMIDEYRKSKPIPTIGMHGIPLRDVIEFEQELR